MTVHLIKLCVGVDDLDDLRAWHERRRKAAERKGEPFLLRHVTRSTPRRADEVLDGGSLYWVIKGQVQARQPIVALEPTQREDGKPACAIVMAPELVETEWRAHRAFQGWRYLDPRDAPRDLGRRRRRGDSLPADMARELRELGLL
ncbi:MAG: DUF1489 domain-containing protein [Rhodospirillales bacterium]